MKKITFPVLFLLGMISSAIAQTTFNKTQTLTLATGGNIPPEGDAPYPIASADVDNDGYADLVVGTFEGGAIFWFKNDGSGSFTAQPTVTTALPEVSDIVLEDINGDATIDIIATSFSGNKLVYYPNSLATPGTFGSEQVVSSSLQGAGDVDIVDLNGDTFPDLVVSAFDDNKVVWYANNGTGGFGAENIIDNTIVAPGSIDMLDIDNDSDLDIVIANATTPGELTSVVEVFYNSASVFTKDPNSVTTGKDYMFNVSFEDIDASNNTGLTTDILATDLYGNLVHYNKEVAGTYSETIIPTSIANPASVGFYDLDNDTLKDILLSSGDINTGNDLVWYKNNGGGNFSSETLIDGTQSLPFKFTLADFDNDGDLDIATSDYNFDQVNIFNNQKIVLSTDNNSMDDLRVHPNPVINQLFITTRTGTENPFLIYDLYGKQLLKGSISNSSSIDVSSLNNGMYFIELKNSNIILKFIKR